MKRFSRRFTALAVAALTAFVCAASIRKQPADDFSGDITAEAAARYYPLGSDFDILRAEKYSELPADSQIRNALKAKVGFEITGSIGLYRDYRIIYTEPTAGASGYSENAVLLYDPALRPELDTVEDEKLRAWMEAFMQFINTEREITGVSQRYLVTVLDAMENGDRHGTWRSKPVADSNWGYSLNGIASLGNYESNELADGITAFDVPYMAWGTLHEASHAYVNDAKSPFVSSDEVFANLRLLCAVRTLKRTGLSFPDVLRQSRNGYLCSERAAYITATAFQYACTDMRNERNNGFLGKNLSYLTSANNGEGSDLFFARLGMLFELGSYLSPWNPAIVNDRAFADQLETDGSFDENWNRLYALCISEPDGIDLGRVPFLMRPKTLFRNYTITQYYNYDYVKKHPKTICVDLLFDGSPAAQHVTANVAYAIERRYCYNTVRGQRVWKCTDSSLRALNTYDFLFGEQNPEAFHKRLNGQAGGHRKITYYDIANEIAV